MYLNHFHHLIVTNNPNNVRAEYIHPETLPGVLKEILLVENKYNPMDYSLIPHLMLLVLKFPV